MSWCPFIGDKLLKMEIARTALLIISAKFFQRRFLSDETVVQNMPQEK